MPNWSQNVNRKYKCSQFCSPTHRRPVESKVRPSGHWHLKEPRVFTQRPLTHTPGNTSHSFTSTGPGEREEKICHFIENSMTDWEMIISAAGWSLPSTFNTLKCKHIHVHLQCFWIRWHIDAQCGIIQYKYTLLQLFPEIWIMKQIFLTQTVQKRAGGVQGGHDTSEKDRAQLAFSIEMGL